MAILEIKVIKQERKGKRFVKTEQFVRVGLEETAAANMVDLLFEFENQMNAHSDARFHLNLAMGVDS